jgi:quercetin dioxygenase-like cupin family protein
LDSKGRRICLSLQDAPKKYAKADARKATTQGMVENRGADDRAAGSHHAFYIQFMRPENGFQNMELEFSGILSDNPHGNGGKHAHMEAILYILQGEGYSIVDGEKVPWKKGSCLHVQGPQTVHQHFNTSDEPSLMLRSAPGIRENFFQVLAKERFPRLWFEQGSDLPTTTRPASAGID